MVNASAPDMPLWNGAGSYGHWGYRSGDSTYAKEQGALDVVFAIACTLGYIASPLFLFLLLRNAIGRFAKTLEIGKKHHVEDCEREGRAPRAPPPRAPSRGLGDARAASRAPPRARLPARRPRAQPWSRTTCGPCGSRSSAGSSSTPRPTG
jgi:hypothetical protein